MAAHKQLLLDEFRDSSVFDDPALAGNKVRPVHRWVPWIAGFSSEFVTGAIRRHLNKRGTILDPFAGVGTTLVDAVLNGHDAVGFEINPYAALAAKVKAGAYRIDDRGLQREIERFHQFYASCLAQDYTPESNAPVGFRTRGEFYSPQVLHKVLVVWDFINGIEEDSIRDVFRLTFAATMVHYSNYSYEPSLGQKKSAGKGDVHDFAVGEFIRSKLLEMCEDILWFRGQVYGKRPVDARVLCANFFRYRDYLEPSTVDLVITSPPYLNNYHYVRNSRPQLYWLGFAECPKDLKFLEEENVGTFWQIARDKVHVPLEFSLSDSDLPGRLDELRQINRGKGVYGGNGWANYAAAYFNDCYRLAQGMDYTLRPGGTAVVVIGNSIIQGMPIATDQYFGEIAVHAGLELVGIHIPRATRVGNSIINSGLRTEQAGGQLYEAVVEVRKPA